VDDPAAVKTLSMTYDGMKIRFDDKARPSSISTSSG
jgi:hypothetical protein